MIARIRKSMDEKDQGFTLIELLVVMIIIGILAAIAIPVFLNQRKKAAETAAKSDATTIGKEMAAYYVDGTSALFVSNSTTLPKQWQLGTTANGTDVSTGKLSAGNVAAGSGTAAGVWCVQVDPSAKVAGAQTWSYSSANGLTQGTCP